MTMSHRHRVSISYAHIFLIAAFFVAAAGYSAAFAQADPNPDAVKAPAQPESTGQSVEQPQPAPAAIDPGTGPQSKTEGVPAMVVDGEHVQGILGKPVRSSAGEDMGRIVDVLVDRSARVRAAVIDFGGFLGVGSRQIAVAWTAIRFPAEGKREPLVLDFTRDQLRVAPAYKAGEQIVLLGAPSSMSDGQSVVASPANNSPAKESPAK
jgi:hypothetical protein